MKRILLFSFATLATLAAALAFWRTPSLSPAQFAAAYTTPLPPPVPPLRVFHLGHSLVGRDMPAMLAQMIGPDYTYASQLGWGASLQQHLSGDIPGFAAENAHPAHASAQDLSPYNTLILTEMVEIRDAIRYHDSANALAAWAQKARAANPQIRVYLYETWHRLDDPEGWLTRLDADLTRYWQDALLRPAMAQQGSGTIFLIPAGQVLAAAARAMESGQIPPLTQREALFATLPDGSKDPIHLNDLGHYLVALTHYAVLTQRPPKGLPTTLSRADGTQAMLAPPEALLFLQDLVWQVVTAQPTSGIPTEGRGF